ARPRRRPGGCRRPARRGGPARRRPRPAPRRPPGRVRRRTARRGDRRPAGAADRPAGRPAGAPSRPGRAPAGRLNRALRRRAAPHPSGWGGGPFRSRRGSQLPMGSPRHRATGGAPFGGTRPGGVRFPLVAALASARAQRRPPVPYAVEDP
ncbi:hypothetical protein E9564_20255, partial [Blastococcus sp. MG754427]|nr:hypothetical protein [Blastococcus sp. MG754427]